MLNPKLWQKGLGSILVADRFLHRGAVLSAGRVKCRTLGTSAQKRKWQRLESKRKQQDLLLEDANNQQIVPTSTKEDGGNPFLFLVVFPIAMTGLVVLFRADFREQALELAPEVQRFREAKRLRQHQADGMGQESQRKTDS